MCKEGFFGVQTRLVCLDAFNVFFGNGTQLIVPFLPEAAHERPFEETIDTEMQLATFLHSIAADIPSVVVEGYGAIGKTLLADGIEGA